ncbi:glycosyltransferase [Candidatus Dojkabacteria bacterium]|nr:glycosyltransferase [Candidatus Dojkabacteria bacterium]
MKLSIIITAWKEERTIEKALHSIIDPDWNDYKGTFEVLIVCPDSKTWLAAKNAAKKFRFVNLKWIKDEGKGKPNALNLAFKEVRGKILILTDGDVHFGKNAVSNLVRHFSDRKVGGVTGRPISKDKKDNFMGYMGHLLADAAHHKRMVTMVPDVKGRSLKIVSKKPHFFVLSGYILAMRNTGIKAPSDCLIEDAYFSYILHKKRYKLAYEPEAKVYVMYSKNLRDWFKQKLRSVGGYIQLWKYNVITPDTKVRNFWRELEYFWFPIRYARNPKQLLWSLAMYPIRMYLWLRIFWEQRILKKSFEKTWVRVESTK